MATFRTLPSGKVQAIIRVRGHKPYSKTFSTPGKAKRWAKQEESNIENGLLRKADNRLFSDLADKYERERVNANQGVQLRSLQNQRNLCNRVSHAFRHSQVSDITTQTVVDYALELKKQGLKGSSIHRYISMISSIFRYGQDIDSFVSENPANKALQWINSNKLIPAVDPRTRRLEPGEYEKIITGLCNYDSDRNTIYALAFRFAIEQAPRQGNLLRLRWEHIKGDCILYKEGKTGNNLLVPLLPGAGQVLDECGRKDIGLIFDSSQSALYRAFKMVCKDAGIIDLTWHDLRREAASRLFEMGFSIPEVASITTHRDWSSLKIYTQIRASVLRDKWSAAQEDPKAPPPSAQVTQVKKMLQSIV